MKLRFALFSILGLLALCLAAAAFFMATALGPLVPNSTQSTTILVARGAPPAQIARNLQEAGIIGDASRFLLVGKLLHRWEKVRSGEYLVSPAQTPLQIFATLTSGISVGHPITVREGENIYEIAAELNRQGVLSGERFLELGFSPTFLQKLGLTAQALGKVPPSAEGYLFPETYQYTRLTSAEELMQMMVKRFFLVWNSVAAQNPQRFGMTVHEIVTLASVIEKETGSSTEREQVSSVFHNRLKKRMRLQSDPTTIYGMWKRYTGNIHRSDLLTPSPYNTYTVPALPVGPISNPGREALAATLNPAQTNYIFFVSHNDGTHQFSETLGQHNAAVQKFQVDRKAREGKSWRDLQKNSPARRGAR